MILARLPVLANAQVQPCPLCHGVDFRALKRNDRYGMGLTTVGCTRCGLLQTNPRPNEEQLDEFYTRLYRRFYQNVVSPSEAYIREQHKDVRMRYTAAFLLQAMERRRIGRMLDVGCSEGALFLALREGGYRGEVAGVEPNPDFARFAAEHAGARVVRDLREADEGYDLITLNHVLEHFLEPVTLLQDIRARLAPQGLLYIDVPDADAYVDLESIHIAHLFHFTRRTLHRMLETAGFTPVSLEAHAPPHHPRSLRLLAVSADAGAHETIVSTPETEARAWRNVAAMRIQPYLLRYLVGRTWAGRKLSLALQRWRGSVRP